MNLWDDQVTGKFHAGLYKNQSHPPVLVIDLQQEKQFSYVCDVLSQEEFLRVRRVASYYTELVLNTVGDATELDPGILDYSSCSLDVSVDVEEPSNDTMVEIDNSPVWSLLFTRVVKGLSEVDKLSVLVDKESEQIIWRKRVEPTK